MKAVVVRTFGPVEALEVGELPEPAAGPGEVVVDVRATAVNFVDLLVVGGKYQFLPELPFAPGKLPSGVVTACGTGVTSLQSGDRVLTLAEHGGYAEKVAVAASSCIRIPDSMSFVDAAAISLSYDTSWFALKDRARYEGGESVLVLGASGAVGLASVQLAKAFGAFVMGAIANPAHAGLVKDAGADAIVDLSCDNLRDGLRDQVRDVTSGKGADIGLDMLGAPYFEAALRALAWRGRLVVIGFAAGEIPVVRANYLLVKNIEVSGLQVSDYRKRLPAMTTACFDELFALYAAGKISAPPHRAYPLAGFAQALRDLQDRGIRDRIILTPDGSK
ncbi:MAG TPA: NADPH:quinone oxidoreductase family protein, partial [Candidatus Cybelea sp.]